jgi:hypothetical protein
MERVITEGRIKGARRAGEHGLVTKGIILVARTAVH